MRCQDDHQRPEHVLYHPGVDQPFGRRVAENLVVNVEQSDQPQIEHRQPHVNAEHVVQRVDGLADQPVPDAEYLDGVGHRMAVEPRPVEVVVVQDHALQQRFAPVRVVRGLLSDERILGAVHVFLLQLLQVVVDAAELGVDPEALRGELGLDAAHAQVLNVIEHVVNKQRSVDKGLSATQEVQAAHVDRHDYGQADGDDGRREHLVAPRLRGRGRRVHFERGDDRLVPGRVPFAAVHHRDPGQDRGDGQRPAVHTDQGRRENHAPPVQPAQVLRRAQEIVHAHGQQHQRVRVLELVVRQIDCEHAAQLPKRPDHPRHIV